MLCAGRRSRAERRRGKEKTRLSCDCRSVQSCECLHLLLIWLHRAASRHTHTHTPALHPAALRPQTSILMPPCLTSHLCPPVLPAVSLLLLLFPPIGWSYDGLTPGCHLYPINVTIRSDRRGTCRGTHLVYACVGYCESSAFPSRYSVLLASNFTHNITSASRCCTISKDAKVKVRLDCPRGRHRDEIEILTAKACRCDMCRRSRY